MLSCTMIASALRRGAVAVVVAVAGAGAATAGALRPRNCEWRARFAGGEALLLLLLLLLL
jgi:hypothetical protein